MDVFGFPSGFPPQMSCHSCLTYSKQQRQNDELGWHSSSKNLNTALTSIIFSINKTNFFASIVKSFLKSDK